MNASQIEATLGHVGPNSGPRPRSGYHRYNADPEPVFELRNVKRISVVRHSSTKGEWHYHATIDGTGVSRHATRSVKQADIVKAGGAL